MSIQTLPVATEFPSLQPGTVSIQPETSSRPRDAMKTVKLPTGVADLSRSEIRHHNGECDELSTRETELLSYLAANADRQSPRQIARRSRQP